MFSSLIENAFRQAQENGDLDNLPGAGKPIAESSLTSDPFAHVYAESGTMTPLGEMQRKIEAAKQRLAGATDPEAKRKIQLSHRSLVMKTTKTELRTAVT